MSIARLMTVVVAAALFSAPALAGKGGGKPPSNPPPAISPDIVYDVADNVDQLGVSDLAGNHTIILHGGNGLFADEPKWLPDGQSIIFRGQWDIGGGNLKSGIFRLRVVDAVGNLLVEQTPELVLEHYGALNPTVSSVADGDGNFRVAYVADSPDGPDDQADIFVFNCRADGTRTSESINFSAIIEQFVDVDDNEYQWRPALSPDGTQIAYVVDYWPQALQSDIFVVDILTTDPLTVYHPRSLTQTSDGGRWITPSVVNGLAYRRNGREVTAAISVRPTGDLYDLWNIVVDDPVPDGSPNGTTNLTETDAVTEAHASWSPDDSQMVYSRIGDELCSSKRHPAQLSGLALRPFGGGDCDEQALITNSASSSPSWLVYPDWRPAAQ